MNTGATFRVRYQYFAQSSIGCQTALGLNRPDLRDTTLLENLVEVRLGYYWPFS